MSAGCKVEINPLGSCEVCKSINVHIRQQDIHLVNLKTSTDPSSVTSDIFSDLTLHFHVLLFPLQHCLMRFVYVLRLVFMLNGNTGSMQGDFMYVSFLEVPSEKVTKPTHSLNRSKRPRAHLFMTRFSLKSPSCDDLDGKKAKSSL